MKYLEKEDIYIPNENKNKLTSQQSGNEKLHEYRKEKEELK